LKDETSLLPPGTLFHSQRKRLMIELSRTKAQVETVLCSGSRNSPFAVWWLLKQASFEATWCICKDLLLGLQFAKDAV
jgi:hypothetical protein